jgi:hypothetical protein
MTNEEIARCKVGDEVEYLSHSLGGPPFSNLKGRIGILRKVGPSGPWVEIPGECPDGYKEWSTNWSCLRYIGKKQRQLTFVFSGEL